MLPGLCVATGLTIAAYAGDNGSADRGWFASPGRVCLHVMDRVPRVCARMSRGVIVHCGLHTLTTSCGSLAVPQMLPMRAPYSMDNDSCRVFTEL